MGLTYFWTVSEYAQKQTSIRAQTSESYIFIFRVTPEALMAEFIYEWVGRTSRLRDEVLRVAQKFAVGAKRGRRFCRRFPTHGGDSEL
jgi:hypothetical protein